MNEELEEKNLENQINEDDEEEGDQRKIYEEQSNEAKKEALFNKMHEELQETAEKLRGVLPENRQLRSLGTETGGLEVNYEEIDRQNDMDKDVWDDYKAAAGEGNTFETTHHHSFIHGKKKGKGKKGRKMGSMRLSDNQVEQSLSSHVARLQQMRTDRSHENDGGISM